MRILELLLDPGSFVLQDGDPLGYERLPLLALAQLTGQGVEQRGLGSKVVVLKSLGGEASLPFFGVMLLVLALVTYVPSVVMFVPKLHMK